MEVSLLVKDFFDGPVEAVLAACSGWLAKAAGGQRRRGGDRGTGGGEAGTRGGRWVGTAAAADAAGGGEGGARRRRTKATKAGAGWKPRCMAATVQQLDGQTFGHIPRRHAQRRRADQAVVLDDAPQHRVSRVAAERTQRLQVRRTHHPQPRQLPRHVGQAVHRITMSTS